MSRTSARAIVAVLLLYSVSGCSGGTYVGPAGHPATASSGTPSTPSSVTPSPAVSGAPAPTATPMPNGTPTPHATATPLPTTSPTPAPTPTLGTSLYVVDSSADAIEVFPLGANGNVAPAYTITGTQAGLPYPAAATFDKSGDLYVANYLTNQQNETPGNVVMFSPPLSGTSAPGSTLSYSGFVGVDDIAVDSSGDLYVLNYDFKNGDKYEIFVFAPGASGNASPTRTIVPSISDTVYSMAIDATTIYLNGISGNQIFEMPLGSNGTVTPTVIAGNATGLDGPDGLRIDYLDRLVVRNVGNPSTITRFAPGATGNATPVSTIDVQSFTANDAAVGSLCLDGGGDVFVTHDPSGSSPAVGFFPISDTGTVSPERSISGSMTGFGFAIGCAVR